MNYKFDIEEIKQQVASVIKYSQNFYFTDLKVDKIIEDWLKAKKFFIDKLDGNLIYQMEKPITFNLDAKSKENKFYQFINYIDNQYNNENLSRFLYSLKTEDFFNNKTSQSYDIYGIEIPENFKIIKSFKFFESDKTILKDIQNEASRIIQENCITGRLCFSVHPLDFLSASENAYNWRSCHALDGEYRSGNLNYLMDSTTVICYLKGEEEAELPHFPSEVPWNSKKWRTWIYFSNDKSMLFAGRQYPFISQEGLYYIKDGILPKIGLGYWGTFYSSKINHLKDELSARTFIFDEKFIPIGKTLKPLTDVVINGQNTYMYNDILKSTCYSAPYAYRDGSCPSFTYRTGYSNDKTKFLVGKECSCPICGEGYIDYPEIMACTDCAVTYDIGDNEDYYICDICGISVHNENVYSLDISHAHVCEHCYQTETKTCQRCGITDFPEHIKYYEGQYLCPECIRKGVL